MTRKRRLLFGLIPALFIANILVLPVSISKYASPVENSHEWVQVPLASTSVTEISLLSGSPAKIVGMQLPWPEVFNINLVKLNEKPVDSLNDLVLNSGDVVKISGMFSDLSITAESQGASSTIELIRSSNQIVVNANLLELPSSNQDYEIILSSPESIWVDQATMLEAITKNSWNDLEILDFTISQRPLDLTNVTSSAALFSSGAAVTFLNWLALFSVMILAGLFWLVGLSVWNTKNPLNPADHFLRIVLGFSLFGLALNTANFFLPGIQASLLVVAVLTTSVILKLRNTSNLSLYFSDLRLQLKDLLSVSIPAFVPLLIAFWPVLLFGFRFSGETKTDFSEYATLASFLRDSSMLAMQSSPEAQSAGVLTSGAGFSWRSIDSAMSSAFGTTLESNSFYGITLLSMLALYLFSLGLLSIFSQGSNHISKKSLLWVSLLATYPLISTISLESYLSQFVFVCLMPAVIVSISYFIKNPNDTSGVWTLSALLAFLGALYPYFLAITLAGVSISLLVNSKQTRLLLRKLVARTFLRTALLLNVAALPIIFYFETNVFQASLNEIARVTLLGPYSKLERIGLVGGVTTYEWRHWEEMPGVYLSFAAKNLWTLGEVMNRPEMLSALILLVSAATLLVLISIVRSSRALRISDESHMLISVFGIWLTVFIFYASTGSTYVALKVLLVAAAAWIVLLSNLIKLIPNSKLIAFSATLFIIWLPVNMLERSHWLVEPLMPEVRFSHFTTVNQVDSLRKFLSDNKYDSVVVAYGEEPLQGSDRDRVLMFNTKTVLRDLRIDCPDCIEALQITDVHCASRLAAPIIVIGGTSFDRSCNRKEVFSSGLISVFE